MMHAAPVLLHWVHSDSPSPTTHRILLSRQEAQAIEARCRICCFVDEREEGAGLVACSELALSLSPSERDLRFPLDIVAVVMNEGVCQLAEVKLRVSGTQWRRFPFWGIVKRPHESGQQKEQDARENGREEAKWRNPNRRIHASGPVFVKCGLHGRRGQQPCRKMETCQLLAGAACKHPAVAVCY
jgi:hypothetical protein